LESPRSSTTSVISCSSEVARGNIGDEGVGEDRVWEGLAKCLRRLRDGEL
jgi:hypothetical protein